MKRSVKLGCWSVVLLFIGSLLFSPNLYIPKEWRATANEFFLVDWLFWKDDLFEGRFPFWREGATMEIELKPEYTTLYCVAISFAIPHPPKEFYYDGKLKAELLWRGKVMKTLALDPSFVDTVYWIDKITIRPFYFYLPLNDWHWNDLAIRLTVIEPNTQLERYADSMVMKIESGFTE